MVSLKDMAAQMIGPVIGRTEFSTSQIFEMFVSLSTNYAVSFLLPFPP